MSTFVFRLLASRPTFAVDMSDGEREIMGRHASYWRPYIDAGQMVVFGPVLDDTGSWGLGVIEVEDEDELRAFASREPRTWRSERWSADSFALADYALCARC
jgi:uncharacterized protein